MWRNLLRYLKCFDYLYIYEASTKTSPSPKIEQIRPNVGSVPAVRAIKRLGRPTSSAEFRPSRMRTEFGPNGHITWSPEEGINAYQSKSPVIFTYL